ncbi:hypothetical protein CH238_10555 [[Clostridium] leptum DSM 753]|uniref:Uncharacterized protein n=1 Tax=[Clostridium] leptum DSM 753 TaxID=428125 RepID=A0A855A2M4_9FIRM|nr:hypothetical protein CH238_10555 [[Clostridium] leptum DSM 753]
MHPSAGGAAIIFLRFLPAACFVQAPGERGVFPVSRERPSPHRELFRPVKTACLLFFHAVSLENPTAIRITRLAVKSAAEGLTLPAGGAPAQCGFYQQNR